MTNNKVITGISTVRQVIRLRFNLYRKYMSNFSNRAARPLFATTIPGRIISEKMLPKLLYGSSKFSTNMLPKKQQNNRKSKKRITQVIQCFFELIPLDQSGVF